MTWSKITPTFLTVVLEDKVMPFNERMFSDYLSEFNSKKNGGHPVLYVLETCLESG